MLYTLNYVLNVIWSDQGPKDAQNRVSKSTLRSALTCVAKHTRWEDGSSSYPTQETLAEESGLSRASLNRALSLLVELGWLSKEKTAPNRSRGVTYKIIIPDEVRQSHGETSHHETTHHETNDCLTVTQTIVSSCDTIYTLNKTLNKTDENRPVAATHTPASAPAHEGQPPAAAGQDFDLGQPDQGRQAASRKPTQTSTAQHGELSAWLVGELKARKAELVRTDAPATPSQVKVCVAAVVALAAGDEGAARRYIEDRLTGFALRGEGRPKSVAVLLGFLVDRGDFAAWERERQETSAQHGSMRRPAHSGSGHYNDPAMKALADIIVM